MQNINRRPSRVVAFWGQDPHCRMEQERTPDKVRVHLEDQLRTNGRPTWLWLPVASTTSGVVACTCDKDTTQNADAKCLSCFGARYVPGFHKFLHHTLHWSSAEATHTLASVEYDRAKKPNRLRLIAGATTGTITTAAKAVTNPEADPIELDLAAYRKIAADTVGLEFSTDNGLTWTAVALTAGPKYGFRGTLTPTPTGGTLRFRITLTRASGTSVESPSFEILRARHVRSADVNPILYQRAEYQTGQILVLKSWDQELVTRDPSRGRIIEHMADRMQTAPLDFFDTTIGRDTPPAALDDRAAGPHPFLEYTSGVRATRRYVAYAINIDSTIDDVMNHQSFSERLPQEELYALCF
jgi:hypothetical protein